jgi:adenosine deaminase
MKARVLLAILTLSGFLVSCADKSTHPMDMTAAVHSAKTRADHEALADHYEAVAQEMNYKAEEHKRILADFRKDPHDYPKTYKGGNFESHCERLIDIYERAAEANRQMAEDHRQMAGGVR